MHCMAGLDAVTSGQAWIGGTELTGLDDKRLTKLRRDQVGFVFQACRTGSCSWPTAGSSTR